MLKETLLPGGDLAVSEGQKAAVSQVAKDFRELARANPEARVYLIGYGTTTETVESAKAFTEGGRLRRDLKEARLNLMQYAVPADRVVIVRMLLRDVVKAGQVGAVVTSVRLPIEVWTEDGLETGKGQPAPGRIGVNPSIETEYNRKKDEVESKIKVEIEIKPRIGFKQLDKITVTVNHDGSAFEEANAEVTFKQKLLKAIQGHALKELSVGIKVSGMLKDDEDTPQKKLTKLKGKLKILLGAEIRAIGGSLQGSFFVDTAGGVGVGAELTIPWD